MIVMTISNWRKKLRIVLIILLLAFLAGSVMIFMQLGKGPAGSAENDRDVNGSLKVEAPSTEAEEVDSNWWAEFTETLKSYYKD